MSIHNRVYTYFYFKLPHNEKLSVHKTQLQICITWSQKQSNLISKLLDVILKPQSVIIKPYTEIPKQHKIITKLRYVIPTV